MEGEETKIREKEEIIGKTIDGIHTIGIGIKMVKALEIIIEIVLRITDETAIEIVLRIIDEITIEIAPKMVGETTTETVLKILDKRVTERTVINHLTSKQLLKHIGSAKIKPLIILIKRYFCKIFFFFIQYIVSIYILCRIKNCV